MEDTLIIDTDGWTDWKCPKCGGEYSFDLSDGSQLECPECNNWPPLPEARH